MDVIDRSAWTRFGSGSGWTRRAWELGQQLRPASESARQLFVVGTPDHDAWHVAAHLDEEARYTGLTSLRPKLLRWRPPAGAAAHLSLGIEQLRTESRGSAVLVVAPDLLGEDALERFADARRKGATLMAVTTPEDELADFAHETAIVDAMAGAPVTGGEDIEFASHVVTVSAGSTSRGKRRFFRR
jgi:hypothetical protein